MVEYVGWNALHGAGGRYSKKEFVQFLYIARGSLYEAVTLLMIFKKRDWPLERSTTNLLARR